MPPGEVFFAFLGNDETMQCRLQSSDTCIAGISIENKSMNKCLRKQYSRQYGTILKIKVLKDVQYWSQTVLKCLVLRMHLQLTKAHYPMTSFISDKHRFGKTIQMT